jgi:hypothetical protein
MVEPQSSKLITRVRFPSSPLSRSPGIQGTLFLLGRLKIATLLTSTTATKILAGPTMRTGQKSVWSPYFAEPEQETIAIDPVEVLVAKTVPARLTLQVIVVASAEAIAVREKMVVA